MIKVVYNRCWGGFSISKAAVLLARKLSGDDNWGDIQLGGEPYSDGSGAADPAYDGSNRPDNELIPRHDPVLVSIVETLGDTANGEMAKLEIYELEGNKYWIEYYDGMETVHTPENTEWIEVKNDTGK